METPELRPPPTDTSWLRTEQVRVVYGGRWTAALAGAAAVILVVTAAAVGASPSDSGTAAQLDRIDSNAYGACVNAAGTNASRVARCTASTTPAPTTVPPTTTAPPTSSAPATTTPPPTTNPPGSCAWPACFPTAATTGVPAGVVLTTVNGDVHLAAGATLDGRDVQGSLIIDGSGVTVCNSRIHGVVRTCDGCTGLTLTDSEITANPGQSYSVGNFPPIIGSYTLLRVHVHRWQDGPRTDQGTVVIRDSLVDELAFASGEHPDAVQQYCPGCEVHVTLDHSSLSGCAGNATDKGNSALFWSDHPGTGSTLLATHNRFACGQFSIRINDTGSGVAGNHPGVTAEVRDNTVAAGSYVNGPAECGNGRAYSTASGDGVRWSGNILDTGQAIASPCS
jgi:hypothetical protein